MASIPIDSADHLYTVNSNVTDDMLAIFTEVIDDLLELESSFWESAI